MKKLTLLIIFFLICSSFALEIDENSQKIILDTPSPELLKEYL